MKQQDDIKLTISAVGKAILIVAVMYLFFWSFMLQRQFNQLEASMEDWSQHIADQVNSQWKVDMKNLENILNIIDTLKKLEEQNAK